MTRAQSSVAAHEQRALMERLFGRIATRYDRFNHLTSLSLDRRWRAAAIAQIMSARTREDLRVLDVCTGTGDLALGVAARLNGASRVVGVDLSVPMLSIVQAKAQARHASIAWLRADAQALPFPDASFDCVTIGFSTRNVPDLSAACREWRRVLRRPGRLVIVETGKPQSWPVQLVYYTYLTLIMPLMGLLICRTIWPFPYLRRSIRRFLSPAAFQALLREAGFQTVTHQPLHGGIADLFVGITA